jgi:hypothetical protein
MVLVRWPEFLGVGAFQRELPPVDVLAGGAIVMSLVLLVLLSLVARSVIGGWLE